MIWDRQVYPLLLKAVILANNSSELSSIMPDEFGEHLTRDQRPFLHTESLQILQIHKLVFLFSSAHSFSTDQFTGLGRSWQKLHFVLSYQFLYWFWCLFWTVVLMEDSTMAHY